MLLHNRRSEKIEEGLGSIEGRARMVVAAAQSQGVARMVAQAHFVGVDIVPPEPRPIVRAQQRLVGVGIGNRLDLTIKNALTSKSAVTLG